MYLKRTDNVEVETMFSKCFTDGTVFYTCLFGETAITGFLRPGDTFDLKEVRPRFWGSFGGNGLQFTNLGTRVKDHEAYHNEVVKRLLKKDSTCCPSRLRKLRNFTFFE